MPAANCEVRPVEEFREADMPFAYYQSPTADNSRPGVYYVNTADLPDRPLHHLAVVDQPQVHDVDRDLRVVARLEQGPDLILQRGPGPGDVGDEVARGLADGVRIPRVDAQQVAAIGRHGVGAAQRLGNADPGAG